MGRKNLIDHLREMVEEQTRDIPTVSNLKGAVPGPQFVPKTNKAQKWTVAEVTAPSSVDNESIFSAFTYENPGVTQMDATLGFVTYPESGGSIGEGKAILMYGTARIRARTTLDVAARGQSSFISVYIDNIQVGVGADDVATSVELSAGDHPIVIVFHGGNSAVTLQTTPTVEIMRAEEIPKPPVWVKLPQPLDIVGLFGISHVIRIVMAWNNGSRAGGWNLYRSKTAYIGDATASPATVNDDKTVTIEMASGLIVNVVSGDHLYTPGFDAGEVVEVIQGASTKITLRPALGAPSAPSNWASISLTKLMPFQSIARVANPGTPTIEYSDLGVELGQVYVYKVTAVSALGSVESDYSAPAWTLSVDLISPQPINWDLDNPPQLIFNGGTITVNFLAPPDPDYKGIHVYGPFSLDSNNNPVPPTSFGSPITTVYGSPNTNSTVSFFGSAGNGYFISTFDQFGNTQPPVAGTFYNGATVTGAYSFAYTSDDAAVTPTLVATASPLFHGYYQILYTGTGTITYSINAGPESAAPPLTFIVPPQIFAQTVTMKATSASGIFVTQTLSVPAGEYFVSTPIIAPSLLAGYIAVGFSTSGIYDYSLVHWSSADGGGDLDKNVNLFVPTPYTPAVGGSFSRTISVYITLHAVDGTILVTSSTTNLTFDSST